jgi:hypothetical protein
MRKDSRKEKKSGGKNIDDFRVMATELTDYSVTVQNPLCLLCVVSQHVLWCAGGGSVKIYLFTLHSSNWNVFIRI